MTQESSYKTKILQVVKSMKKTAIFLIWAIIQEMVESFTLTQVKTLSFWEISNTLLQRYTGTTYTGLGDAQLGLSYKLGGSDYLSTKGGGKL